MGAMGIASSPAKGFSAVLFGALDELGVSPGDLRFPRIPFQRKGLQPAARNSSVRRRLGAPGMVRSRDIIGRALHLGSVCDVAERAHGSGALLLHRDHLSPDPRLHAKSGALPQPGAAAGDGGVPNRGIDLRRPGYLLDRRRGSRVLGADGRLDSGCELRLGRARPYLALRTEAVWLRQAV